MKMPRASFRVLLLLAGSCCARAQGAAASEESSLKTRYSVSVIDDATFYGNLREPLPGVLNQFWSSRPSVCITEPSQLLYQLDRTCPDLLDNYSQLRVKESFAGVSAGDFDFTAGRKMVRWGTGYAFNRGGRA